MRGAAMSLWLSALKRIVYGGNRGRGGRARGRRPAPWLAVEQLEARVNPSTLDVVGGVLKYTAASGETNALTVSVTGGTYNFTDTGATITLGSGATSAGWALSNSSHTAKGPDSGLSSLSIDLGDKNDTANIQSINEATTVLGGDGNDTVNVSSNAPTNTGNLAGIAADLTIDAGAGTNSLVVSDFGAASGNGNVVIGNTSITGLAGPSDNVTINYSATGGSFSLLRAIGSNTPSLAEAFTIDNPNGTFRLDANAGADTANVRAIGASATLSMGAGNDVVNVSSDAPTNLGNLDGVNGTLTIDGGTGSNVLKVSDYGQTATANANVTVTPTQITGFAGSSNGSTINYSAPGGSFSGITLDGSNSLGDSFNISGKTSVNVNGNGGGDTFTFASDGSTAGAIGGGSGSDALNYANYSAT